MQTPEDGTEIVRAQGMCGELNEDKSQLCLLPIGHKPPHGWDRNLQIPPILLPAEPGDHVWVLNAICPLTPSQVFRVALGEQILMSEWNADNTLVRGPGCFICMADFQDAYDTPCPGVAQS